MMFIFSISPLQTDDGLRLQYFETGYRRGDLLAASMSDGGQLQPAIASGLATKGDAPAVPGWQ